MAQVAIFAALKALGDALANEVVRLASSQTSELLSLFSELECNMNRIRSELQMMQVFLDEINTHDSNNKILEAWLVEARNLAYHIQDIVDEFIYLSNTKENGGIRSYVKRLFQNPSLLRFKQLASQLQQAEKSLNNLAASKEQWVSTLPNTGLGSNLTYNYNESPHHAAVSALFIEEDKLIGLEKNREILTSWIYSERSNLSVISVWGMGGLGKTTLVTNVFKREKHKFDCNAWVSISQRYTVDHLLRNLIAEICESVNTTNMDHRKLKETLRELLKEKKYLIILDDAWDPTAFKSINDTLVDNHKGSRVVITSRNKDVASIAPEEHMLQLMPLADIESYELFCRWAFQFETNHKCPPGFESLAREFVLKCNGLPLALVSIGGMLSLAEKSVIQWKRVHDQLRWELEHNRSFDNLRNILILSFIHLPRNLKNCFLYCCMFPEDRLIQRKKLIRLWVAEGFIEEKGASTLEEVAEGYLVELIRRSMLQLVETNEFGRVKRCRMHDTLRELGIPLCMKENFGLVYEDNKIVRVDTTARRLSVNEPSNEISFNANMSQLRTFLSFNPALLSSLLSSTLLKSRYLAVLDLEGLPIETLPDTIGDLFNLRYLGLRETKVKSLPDSIEKLHYLQTLDLLQCNIQKFNSIIKLRNLRHLFAEYRLDEMYLSLKWSCGVVLPKGLDNLKNLQTLQALEANDEVVKEIGDLTQLRSFRIINVKESYYADLCKALSKMMFLSYLHINGSDEDEFIQLEHLNQPPPQLQKLHLCGRLNENIFQSALFQVSGKNLLTLYLGWSRLHNDPLPSLSHLSNLTFLCFNRAYDGQQLVFRAGWFPKLKTLVLKQLPSLIQVEMEKGTMLSVEWIIFRHMKQLTKIPKGMEHLIALKGLYCDGLSPNFGGSVKGHKLWRFICHTPP